MTGPLNLGNICGSPMRGVRRITLPDGDQVGLIGLDTILGELYREGRAPDDATVSAIIDRLREKNNYIGGSPPVLELYRKALLNEYRRFCENKKH